MHDTKMICRLLVENKKKFFLKKVSCHSHAGGNNCTNKKKAVNL